jgi:hypothetical protein
VISQKPSARSGNITVSIWRVRCDCGTETNVRTGNLKAGRTKSCGRFKCPYSRSQNPYPAGGVRQIWNLTRHRALRKGIEFSLSPEEVEAIIFQPCFYCGGKPTNTARSESRLSKITCNGIDRRDCRVGYVKGNVFPCCWKCNTMKNSLSVAEFSDHIKLLASRCGSW